MRDPLLFSGSRCPTQPARQQTNSIHMESLRREGAIRIGPRGAYVSGVGARRGARRGGAAQGPSHVCTGGARGDEFEQCELRRAKPKQKMKTRPPPVGAYPRRPAVRGGDHASHCCGRGNLSAGARKKK